MNGNGGRDGSRDVDGGGRAGAAGVERVVGALRIADARLDDATWDDARLEDVTLVELLDRLLGGGVVVSADVTLSVAGVDLIHVSLRALVSSVQALRGP